MEIGVLQSIFDNVTYQYHNNKSGLVYMKLDHDVQVVKKSTS